VPAGSSSPIEQIVARVGSPSDRVSDTDVPRGVDTAGSADLVAALAKVPDPRARRGIRHRLVTVLALAVCAVLAGARSYVAVAEWAHDLPLGARVRLGLTVVRATPSESAIRRILQKVDPEALDRVVSDWLVTRAARPSPPTLHPSGNSAPQQRAGSGPARIAASPSPTVPSPRVIAVDGKSARGARQANERAVHLLAALDTSSGIVLGQSVVDGKSNEVRHEAPCRIPNSVRRNLEDSSWVRWLTRSRNGQWEPKHAINPRSCPDARSDALGGTRVIWRKLNCLNPNLQRCKSSSTGKGICNRCRALHPVISLPGATSRALGDIQ
jgi:hypothetical protein